jgi:hypothetical protein
MNNNSGPRNNVTKKKRRTPAEVLANAQRKLEEKAVKLAAAEELRAAK